MSRAGLLMLGAALEGKFPGEGGAESRTAALLQERRAMRRTSTEARGDQVMAAPFVLLCLFSK